MQMGMLTPHEIGVERDSMDSEGIFGLKSAEKNGAMKGLQEGVIPEELDESEDGEDLQSEGGDKEGDLDDLEAQLDIMYML